MSIIIIIIILLLFYYYQKKYPEVEYVFQVLSDLIVSVTLARIARMSAIPVRFTDG